VAAKRPDTLNKSASDCRIDQFQKVLSIPNIDVAEKCFSEGEV
jgi:hypothetical protein